MQNLFTPLKIKSLEIKNRIWVSPMCQYSSIEGHPNDWHFVHLGSRAVGGSGLIVVEATAVSPEGRISPADSGIWSEDHIKSFKRITDFVKEQGAAIGIQLAHAGIKASKSSPWLGNKTLSSSEGGWQTVGPDTLSTSDIAHAVQDFELATERTLKAGFQVLELHMAHGYLMHEFLSPITNHRTDHYGGSLENRMRFPLEVVKATRKKWPTELPLFVRISATDWADDSTPSWKLEDSIVLAKKLKEMGVDLIDCSSGGTLANAEIPVGPGYQVPFSEAIRKDAGILTAAVGMITDPDQAESILEKKQSDAIFMAREFLRDPYWPLHAAKHFGIKIHKAVQYGRS